MPVTHIAGKHRTAMRQPKAVAVLWPLLDRKSWRGFVVRDAAGKTCTWVPEDQLRTTKKLCVPHRLGALEYSSGRSVIGQFHYVLQGRAATTATRRSAGSSTSPRSPPTCSTAPASGRRVMQRGRDCIRGPRLRWIGLSPSSRRKCESSRCTDDDSGWRGYVGTAAQIQQKKKLKCHK